MAAVEGIGGRVKYAGKYVAQINTWSLDLSDGLLETTSWSTGTDQWRTYTDHLADATGAIGGFWDAINSTGQKELQTNILTPSTATVELWLDNNPKLRYEGTALLVRQGVNPAIDGTVDASWDFQFTGGIKYRQGTSYLYLPGTSGEYVSSADTDRLSLTGDFDIRIELKADDWTPAAIGYLLAKHNGAINTTGYSIRIDTDGTIHAIIGDGAANIATSSAATGLTNGTMNTIRVTYDASADDVTFYTGDWGNETQLGNVISSGATSITATGTALHVGILSNGSSSPFAGGYSRVQIRNSINGPLVFDADFRDLTKSHLNSAAFQEDANGATVTINGDEWAYVREEWRTVSQRAEAIYRAADGNGGYSAKWADRSGNQHHAELGSAAGADSNDPTFYDHTGNNYVRHPGIAGNLVATPHSDVGAITGNVTLTVDVAMDDWTPSASTPLIVKASGNDGFDFRVLTSGVLRLTVGNGATTENLDSTVAAGLTDGTRHTIEAVWTDATSVVFNVDGVKLGATVAGSLTLSDSGTALTSSNVLVGDIYNVTVVDDGTTVASLRADAWTDPSVTYTDAQSNVWTISRSGTAEMARLVDRPHWWLDTDDSFTILDNANLDFGASDDLTIAAAFRPYNLDGSDQMLWSGGRQSVATSAVGISHHIDTATLMRTDLSDGTTESPDTQGTLAEGVRSVTMGVRDTTADTVTTYVDGTGSGSADDTTGTLTNAIQKTIGGNAALSAQFFTGEIFAIALFREALNAADRAALQNELTP